MNPNPYIDEDLQALAEHARRFATDRVAPGQSVRVAMLPAPVLAVPQGSPASAD